MSVWYLWTLKWHAEEVSLSVSPSSRQSRWSSKVELLVCPMIDSLDTHLARGIRTVPMSLLLWRYRSVSTDRFLQIYNRAFFLILWPVVNESMNSSYRTLLATKWAIKRSKVELSALRAKHQLWKTHRIMAAPLAFLERFYLWALSWLTYAFRANIATLNPRNLFAINYISM